MRPYEQWGDSHNTPLYGLGILLMGTPTGWCELQRCTVCGAGDSPGSVLDPAYSPGGLCRYCGASNELSVRWIGRRYTGGRCIWASLDTVPKALRPEEVVKREQEAFDALVQAAVEVELEKRLDAEFEARVRAAVEVELALRMSKIGLGSEKAG